jgi:hypothetical protein
MAEQHSSIEITPTDARQGSKEGVVRYVLGISLTLVIIGFIAAYFFS